MLKKITYILSAVMLCSCVMLVPSFESKAAETKFEVSYSEPSTSDTQGYCVFLLENLTTGERIVNTWFWSIYAINSSNNVVPAEMLVDATSSNVTFNIYQNGASSIAYCLNNITSAGRYRMKIHTSSQKYVHDYGAEGYKVISWIAEGNVCMSSLWASETFSVLFTDDADAIILRDLLEVVDSFRRQYVVAYGDISLELAQIDGNIESILNNTNSMCEKINAIYNLELNIQGNVSVMKDYIIQYFPSLSSKIDTLIEKQTETNTWLEKIFDYLQESQEQQKQEAQTQGNSSISQGSSAIEDKGGDFAGSLGGLVSSMSYNGTDCSWTFPKVTLPAISGVMDEVTLIESQPIDFSFWINAIPSGIMLTVQSLLTIGLIIYCFKELYGTIEYVLTLRKGGGNE